MGKNLIPKVIMILSAIGFVVSIIASAYLTDAAQPTREEFSIDLYSGGVLIKNYRPQKLEYYDDSIAFIDPESGGRVQISGDIIITTRVVNIDKD